MYEDTAIALVSRSLRWKKTETQNQAASRLRCGFASWTSLQQMSSVMKRWAVFNSRGQSPVDVQAVEPSSKLRTNLHKARSAQLFARHLTPTYTGKASQGTCTDQLRRHTFALACIKASASIKLCQPQTELERAPLPQTATTSSRRPMLSENASCCLPRPKRASVGKGLLRLCHAVSCHLQTRQNAIGNPCHSFAFRVS